MDAMDVLGRFRGKPIQAVKGRFSVCTHFVLAVAVVVLLSGTSLPSASAASAPVVESIRLGINGQTTRLVIDIDREVDVETFALDNPDRLVIDLPQVKWEIGEEGRRKGTGLIQRFRYGLFREGTSRLVLDLDEPAKLSRFFVLPAQGPQPVRLVFDLIEVDRQSFAADTRKRHRVKPSQPKPVATTTNDNSAGFRRMVVIDPGHGGVDPGTLGITGMPEKDVVLEIARAVRAELSVREGYDVMLTRDKDIFLRLRDRIERARAVDADLFISIHADSIKNKRVRGSTVYTLSETASDKEAAALARKENKADLIAGIDLRTEAPEVADILIDLAQRETMNYSARFANYLVPELGKRMVLRTNSHRFAGFVVLKAPDVPSVLLEVGYLSNRRDAQILTSAEGRQDIARAIAAAVERYFRAVDAEEQS